MPTNHFFDKKGPFPLNEIIQAIGYGEDLPSKTNFKIHGLESLDRAKENDITFLNSTRYKDLSLKTKASACITSKNFSKFLPDKCIKINVKNILFTVTQISRMFYPKADIDYPDMNLTDSSSRQLSECQYLESLVFRLGNKIEDEFDDILKDMHFKY